MIPIRFGAQTCADLDAGSAREWLLADGTGGYAMGTVSGLRTRRYHALLVIAGGRNGIADRTVGLASLDPMVAFPSGREVRLATHEWASGAVAPTGHEFLASFDLDDGLPRWRWRVGDVLIEREIAMRAGGPCVAVVHRQLAGGPIRLALDALVTWRNVHGERTAAGPPPRCFATALGISVEDAFRLSGSDWQSRGEWWRGAHHREEAARGLTAEEDLWYAGRFNAELRGPGDTAEVVAWAGSLEQPAPRAIEIVSSARARHRGMASAVAARSSGPLDSATVGSLAVAADAFVVRTKARPDVVAGYPWFGAWSRDTMLSYPGLFLATGRSADGRELLRAYAETLSGGMLANTADTGEVRYNTVDGTLWFAYAVERHVAATGDTDLAHELAPALRDVIAAHVAGARFGIGATDEGLLTQGVDGEALTWMDARVDGVAITPRIGKPVEVNALWINALASVAALSGAARQPAVVSTAAVTPGDGRRVDLDALLGAARSAFAARFPRPDGTLHDVIDGPDPADRTRLRPNQLLAWSLPYAPLQPDPNVLGRIGAALVTPLGLRTLNPADPDFRPRHRGGTADRDRAYHQGTVWPWLIGPYVDACRRAGVGDVSDATLTGLVRHIGEYGLGSVSETADGAAPYAATGCPFQAWSVAELLRVGSTPPA